MSRTVGSQGQPSRDDGARPVIVDHETATDLFGAVPHGSEAKPRLRSSLNSTPVVRDRQSQYVVVDIKCQLCASRRSMSSDIRQRFRCDPVRGCLDLRRKRWQIADSNIDWD